MIHKNTNPTAVIGWKGNPKCRNKLPGDIYTDLSDRCSILHFMYFDFNYLCDHFDTQFHQFHQKFAPTQKCPIHSPIVHVHVFHLLHFQDSTWNICYTCNVCGCLIQELRTVGLFSFLFTVELMPLLSRRLNYYIIISGFWCWTLTHQGPSGNLI